MAIGSPGVVGASGTSGWVVDADEMIRQNVQENNPQDTSTQKRSNRTPNNPQAMSGQGAQFIYVAATVANILCDNLTQIQINLLANFLSVVTTCVYAILTVENPTDILET